MDVTLALLEIVRLRLRGLVRFVEKTRRNPIYTDFEDTLGDATTINLPGITPGTNFERFRSKARAFLKKHDDHVALQRLRRNKQLTPGDMDSLEVMLVAAGGQRADIVWATGQPGGLGLFIRSLVGLDRAAAVEAFGHFLDGGSFTVDQVRFIDLIVDELTANGSMEPARLFESPYRDYAPVGPGTYFPDTEVDAIVEILGDIRERTV